MVEGVGMNIEIGGGPSPMWPQFTQVDLIDWKERTGLDYVIADARKLPFDDDTVTTIFASNMLEHVSFLETDQVLREWRRVLVKDGLLTVIVPDLLGIFNDFRGGINTWDEFVERVYGSQTYDLDLHRAGFTKDTFAAVLERNGFRVMSLRSSHAGGGVEAVATHVF